MTIEDTDSYLTSLNSGSESACLMITMHQKALGFANYVGRDVMSFAYSNTNSPRWGDAYFVLGADAGRWNLAVFCPPVDPDL
jgi:hypothetical protein